MKDIKVICISGKAQHGKDTSATYLREILESRGKTVLIAHYGDLVKHIATKFFDWDGVKDEAGRTILQYIGTDVIRRESPNYWVDFIIDMLNFFYNEWDYVLIPDARFPNEITKLGLADFDTYHVRVVRPGFVGPLTPEQQAHPSETALDDFRPDWTIVNAGTLTELYGELKNLANELQAVNS